LVNIPNTSKLGEKLLACGREAERTSSRQLPAMEWRDAILQLRSERTALEAERTAATQDPEVDAFLDALAENEATLRIVTTRVYDWLEKNGALDIFKVSARS
jgi:hypothetical protein